MRVALSSVVVVLALGLAGCPALSLLYTPAAPRGGPCKGNWDCGPEDVCKCGICESPDTVASCEFVPNSTTERCGPSAPRCTSDCADEFGHEARCGDDGWVCEDGFFLEFCPIGECTGAPRPGQVCSDGTWVCSNGSLSDGTCYTPGFCDNPNGPTIAPGCVYDPACSSGASCRNTWCATGTLRPAVCAGGDWVCDVGVLAESCPRACQLMTPPPCYADCGNPFVVGRAACTEGGFFDCIAEDGSRRGVLRSSCPEGTCWDERPPGASVCEGGIWQCADGRGPGGGCLTPGTCGSEPPGCHAALCCDDTPMAAACEQNAWTCGALNSVEDCRARPFCDLGNDGGLDAGFEVRDAGSDDLDAGNDTPDADAIDAGRDASVSDAGTHGPPPTVTTTPVCGDDVFEPNNSRADMLVPTTGGDFQGMRLCTGDVDWFLLGGTGVFVDARMSTTDGAHLELYSPTDGFIAESMLESVTDAGTRTHRLFAQLQGSPDGHVIIVVPDDGTEPLLYSLSIMLASP